jgi:hypothetical protein
VPEASEGPKPCREQVAGDANWVSRSLPERRSLSDPCCAEAAFSQINPFERAGPPSAAISWVRKREIAHASPPRSG